MKPMLTRERILRWLAAAGYGLGLAFLVLLVMANGGKADDAHAYWLAGRHVLEGTPLYITGVEVQTVGAWKYPPLFAQMLAPLSLMPDLLFAWLLRLVAFGCLRGIMGSWRNVGIALLFPPVLDELNNVNVTFIVAFLAMQSLRGRSQFLPVAIALKFGPALLVPFILLRRPEARRKLLIGVAAFAGLCGLSFLVSPGSWMDYLGSIAPQGGGSIAGPGILSFASSGMVDLAIRGSAALVVTGIAIAFDAEWLAWAAAVITAPVLFFDRFAPLVALFFWPERPAQEFVPVARIAFA